MNYDILVVGESLMDRVLRDGVLIAETPGGSPANVAITLGRLGRRPALATTIGNDAAGEKLRAWLAESEVRVEDSAQEGFATSRATAILDAAGVGSYEFDIQWDPLFAVRRRAMWVHTGSIASLLDPGAAVVLELVGRTRRDSMISYDPNIRPSLLGDRSSVVRRVEQFVGLSDVVKASDEDLYWLYPDRDVEASAAAWLQLGPTIVAVTRGSEGVFGLTADGRTECAAVRVDVADTVGAGDTFMGTLIDGLITAGVCRASDSRGVSSDVLAPLLQRSAIAAGITVSRIGADPPWLAELDQATLRAQHCDESGDMGHC